MAIGLIIFLNFIISFYGLYQTVERAIYGLKILYKFHDSGLNSENGADIGAYITVLALNIILLGIAIAYSTLKRYNALIYIQKLTILFYFLTLLLVDISLLTNIFYLTDVR